MVGVAESDPGVAPLRAGAHDTVGVDPADHPGQVAQVQGGLDPAVRIAEEAHVTDADAFRGGHLLGPAQGRDFGPWEVLVEAAGVAVGHHAVDHLDPCFQRATVPAAKIIIRNGQKITLNNRSLLALRRAGIEPKVIIDRTGMKEFELILNKHLKGNAPSDVIKIRGGPPGTSRVSP